MKDVAAYILLAAGMLLQLIAVLGVCVMRDTLDRLHCVSLAGWGTLLVAVAILVEQYFSLLGDKALLAGFLTALLSPVLVHTTARSARIRTRGDWRALEDYPVEHGKP